MSLSGGAEACDRLGSGGLGRPLWGVAWLQGLARGKRGSGRRRARSIAQILTIVFVRSSRPRVC